MTRPAALDHLLSRKKPRRRTITMVMSDEVVDAVEMARENLLGATTDEQREAARLELQAAEAALAEESITLTFQSVGRKVYDELVLANPPTEQQNTESKRQVGQEAPYNVETFAPALIAASCVEPEMSVDQARELFDDWNTGEVMELFFAALEVNTSRRTANLGKASGRTTG